MSDSSWPPPVRDAHNPEEQPYSRPDTAAPGPQEPVGAIDPDGSDDVSDEGPEDVLRGVRKERLLTGLLIGGLVVMTALAATFLTFWLTNSNLSPEEAQQEVRTYLDEQRAEVEERARIAVDILINYDSANLEERRSEMLAISTGGFRDDYDQFTESLGSVLEEAGASSTGSILEEPDISFTSPEEAHAIARVEQIAQTRENPTGRTIEYILQVGLIDTQDGWKVDNIEILSDEVS